MAMEARSHVIFLEDEAPSIGSGRRTVWAKEGRKWAHIWNNDGRARLLLPKWERIKAESAKRRASGGWE